MHIKYKMLLSFERDDDLKKLFEAIRKGDLAQVKEMLEKSLI